MTLSLEDVQHIADLARLDLTDDEINTYQEQLAAILDFIASLQTLDTTGIQPTARVNPAHNVLREDLAQSGLPLEKLLANAPDVENEQFKIPPIFD